MLLDLFTCRYGEGRGAAGYALLSQVYLHGAAERLVPDEDGCAPDLLVGSLATLARIMGEADAMTLDVRVLDRDRDLPLRGFFWYPAEAPRSRRVMKFGPGVEQSGVEVEEPRILGLVVDRDDAADVAFAAERQRRRPSSL